jgi:hypothetical protein
LKSITSFPCLFRARKHSRARDDRSYAEVRRAAVMWVTLLRTGQNAVGETGWTFHKREFSLHHPQ